MFDGNIEGKIKNTSGTRRSRSNVTVKHTSECLFS